MKFKESVTVYKDGGQQGLLVDFLWSVSFSFSDPRSNIFLPCTA